MNLPEVAKLLTYIAVFDRRWTITDDNDVDVMAWHEILPPNLTLETAMAAVKKHYGTPAEGQFDPVMTTRVFLRAVKMVQADQQVAERRRMAVEYSVRAKQLEAGGRRQPLRIGGMGLTLKSPDDA